MPQSDRVQLGARRAWEAGGLDAEVTTACSIIVPRAFSLQEATTGGWRGRM